MAIPIDVWYVDSAVNIARLERYQGALTRRYRAPAVFIGRKESNMSIRENFTAARKRWRAMTVYNQFEHFVLMFLTALIAVVIVAGLWNLTLKIFHSLILTDTFRPHRLHCVPNRVRDDF